MGLWVWETTWYERAGFQSSMIKVMVSCSAQKESPLTRALSQWGGRKELLTSFRVETR